MPNVTLEHIFPATYVTAPISAMYPNRPDWVGANGMLGVLDVRYGSDESRMRQICAFISDEASFITSPGQLSREGTTLTHVHREKLKTDVLRDPLRDDLSGEYVNVWQLTGTELDDPQERAAFLESLKARWRVLRRAELGEN